MCCPGEVQGLLSPVLHLVEVRVGSPILMTTGITVSSATDAYGLGGKGRIASVPCLCYRIQISNGDSSPMLTILRLAISVPIWLALLCFAGEEQGLFS